jgi:signal transduction histidine kinase
VLDTTTPIRREDGTLYRLGGVAKDITPQREAEAARRRLEAQLVQAHKLEALGTLAAGIAHNFNNALAVIIGNVDLARAGGLDNRPLVEECLEMVVGASERAKTLVRQILTFGRQHATELRAEDLGPLVSSAVELLRSALPGHVQMTVRIDPGTPTVFVDGAQIQQVVANLATNAADTMSDRDGLIELMVDRFEATAELVQAEPDLVVGPYARITVSDNGAGMDERTRRRLFEPFFTTKEPSGTGLGLSVVHGVMARHGGTIRVRSELGAGSRFELYFPARTLPPITDV